MKPTAPSNELEKWLIYELDNIHLKENAPDNVKAEFEEKFNQATITVK